MPRWTEGEVLTALPTAEPVGRNGARTFTEVGTDTRTLESGALFVALRGERYDAHAFLDRARAAGARAAVVERIPEDAPDLTYYRVPDTLVALGRLARHRRRALDAPVCAITGTNGKTTTKEMVRAVLRTRWAVHATTANLNNLVGAPLTILSAPDGTEALVVEIGTNAFGEIARLADLVEADIGVITSVAEGHLEGFGNLEGVLHEKTSMLPRLRKGGVALVADEPAALVDRARSLVREVRVAGWTDRADPSLRAEGIRIGQDGRPRFRWQDREVTLRFGGWGHVRNALLALGVGRLLHVPDDAAVAALEGLEPPPLRGEVRAIGGLTVLADCYNANPSSVASALNTLLALPRDRRVVVVGSMLELGARSERLHRDVARLLAGAELDLIVATGLFVPAFEAHAEALGDRLLRVDEVPDAAEPLLERLTGTEAILLKGSRGVALERLLPHLEARFGGPAKGA